MAKELIRLALPLLGAALCFGGCGGRVESSGPSRADLDSGRLADGSEGSRTTRTTLLDSSGANTVDEGRSRDAHDADPDKRLAETSIASDVLKEPSRVDAATRRGADASVDAFMTMVASDAHLADSDASLLVTGPIPTVTYGPGGTTVFATFDPVAGVPDAAVDIRPDCVDVPNGLFATQLGPCLRVTTSRTLVGMAKVCFPNPSHSGALTYVVECSPAFTTTPPSGPKPLSSGVADFLLGMKYCVILPGGIVGNDPFCGNTEHLDVTLAAGITKDIDNDNTADVVDNCPQLSNFNQRDRDSDGVGDACDNCPDIPNRDQADADNDEVGDACESLDAGAGPGGDP